MRWIPTETNDCLLEVPTTALRGRLSLLELLASLSGSPGGFLSTGSKDGCPQMTCPLADSPCVAALSALEAVLANLEESVKPK